VTELERRIVEVLERHPEWSEETRSTFRRRAEALADRRRRRRAARRYGFEVLEELAGEPRKG